jgi:hypothetical protein
VNIGTYDIASLKTGGNYDFRYKKDFIAFGIRYDMVTFSDDENYKFSFNIKQLSAGHSK